MNKRSIIVIDENNNRHDSTYLRRANGLVLNGRARWVDDKTICLLCPPLNQTEETKMIYNEEAYFEYMVTKKRKNLDEHSVFLNELFAMFGDNPPSHEVITEFRKIVRKKGLGVMRKVYRILDDFVDFCVANEHFTFIDAYETHLSQVYEVAVRKKMRVFIDSFSFIPDDMAVNPLYLKQAGLTNVEFVKAFRDLQEIVYAVYGAIESGSPFEWGWDAWQFLMMTDRGYAHILNILHSLAHYNSLDGDVLVVDRKCFFSWDWNKDAKAKSKTTLVKMAEFGFKLDGIDGKSETFRMSCVKNPHVMRLIHTLEGQLEVCGNHLNYIHIQDPATLPLPTDFKSVFRRYMTAYTGVEVFDGGHVYVFADKKIATVGYDGKTIRLWLKNILQQEKFAQEIAALPNKFKSKFKRRARKPCPCGEQFCYKNKRNEKVFEYTYDGVKYEMCEQSSFAFKEIDEESMSIYFKLLELEYGMS